MIRSHYHRDLPEGFEELGGLSDLALDLRWTWSHFSDRLWEFLDPEIWERTRNPYYILQSVSRARLQEVIEDEAFKTDLGNWLADREIYLNDPGWFGQRYASSPLKKIAYFSMEFGLSESLPIYSGGLGILAGDHLKTASDLGVPLVGIGLLYQQGYFRQFLSMDHSQMEAFPYNDPTVLPVLPVQNHNGGLLRIKLILPGRSLLLRVWEARIGKVPLYLLDSNDPLNSPWDRGVTATLYPTEKERRLVQEIVLGIGGWLVLEHLGIDVEVCHLNEGHAAFAVLARANHFTKRTGQPFFTALSATRAGNVFTTHTAVEAAFDRFGSGLIRPYAERLSERLRIPLESFMALGRQNGFDPNEPFNMAYLAMRGSGSVNGVSRLHGAVSRRLFQPLFPRWAPSDVPVGSITNGVHMPSWDSAMADEVWTRTCGKERWLGAPEALCASVESIPPSDLWRLRTTGRRDLVEYVRRRLVYQLKIKGAPAHLVARARKVLDPHALTLGFARRFTSYKRPTLILHDAERLGRLLCHPERPVQLIVAGKAHPGDKMGKELVRQMAEFAARPELFHRAVFLEDYDITLAQELTAGIDVWINTPRRPWEACGTSGMKVLVNGGVNLSALDGWWAEAQTPEVGWSIGDGQEHDSDPEWDAKEAGQLYDLLERDIIPEFYQRDSDGIPAAWVRRILASMSRLTPQFSTNRMLREYIEKAYLPAAKTYLKRAEDKGKIASELAEWEQQIHQHWGGIRFGEVGVEHHEHVWKWTAQVFLGDCDPNHVRVEIFAEPVHHTGKPVRGRMNREAAIPENGFIYSGTVPSNRPAEHYTLRIIPYHPEANVPLELNRILWQR